MIDLSLAGLLGAVVGIVVAALVYGPVVVVVDRALKARQPDATAEERATLAVERALLRRAVLAVDIILFAGIGYWIGQKIAG
jgi:hypothetical protein